MTQEEKQLLLIDLCARLPYECMLRVEGDWFDDEEREPYDCKLTPYSFMDLVVNHDCDVKPYLRPMSDMTFEEACKYIQYKNRERGKTTITIQNPNYTEGCGLPKSITMKTPEIKSDFINFLIANHLDINGLIPMGLAIAVTEKNNPYERF